MKVNLCVCVWMKVRRRVQKEREECFHDTLFYVSQENNDESANLAWELQLLPNRIRSEMRPTTKQQQKPQDCVIGGPVWLRGCQQRNQVRKRKKTRKQLYVLHWISSNKCQSILIQRSSQYVWKLSILFFFHETLSKLKVLTQNFLKKHSFAICNVTLVSLPGQCAKILFWAIV